MTERRLLSFNLTEQLQIRYRNGRMPQHDCSTALFRLNTRSREQVGMPIDDEVRNRLIQLGSQVRLPSVDQVIERFR